mmetsp:Transcript_84302/g.188205  ORF Transcript_84302/g.188205 Transcript_84302/m.188205 type:complete len:211 (-) Transcript_84302:83-715(-)
MAIGGVGLPVVSIAAVAAVVVALPTLVTTASCVAFVTAMALVRHLPHVLAIPGGAEVECLRLALLAQEYGEGDLLAHRKVLQLLVVQEGVIAESVMNCRAVDEAVARRLVEGLDLAADAVLDQQPRAHVGSVGHSPINERLEHRGAALECRLEGCEQVGVLVSLEDVHILLDVGWQLLGGLCRLRGCLDLVALEQLRLRLRHVVCSRTSA